MATYVNADGLVIRTGQDQGLIGKGGEYNVGGSLHWVELDLDLPTLGLAATIPDDKVILPANARIEEVELYVETAAVGATAVLNIGVNRLDRTTVVSATGLVAAAAVATLTPAGTRLTLTRGSTAAGTLIGTTLVNPGLITADYDTAAFTAGRLKVRVLWYRP